MGLFDIFNASKAKSENKHLVQKNNKLQSDTQELLSDTQQRYDMNSLEGIRAIPVPAKNYSTGNPTEDCIYYILQKKATEHKKNNRLDLAIECLRKSNELSDYEDRPLLTETQYKRLLKFLEKAGRSDEIPLEEEKMKKLHPDFFGLPAPNKNLEECKKNILSWESKHDCVLVSTKSTCKFCSKFNGKIFSIWGKSKEFSILPSDIQRSRCPECDCVIGYSVYFPDILNNQ